MRVVASTSNCIIGIDTLCACTSPSHKLDVRLDSVI